MTASGRAPSTTGRPTSSSGPCAPTPVPAAPDAGRSALERVAAHLPADTIYVKVTDLRAVLAAADVPRQHLTCSPDSGEYSRARTALGAAQVIGPDLTSLVPHGPIPISEVNYLAEVYLPHSATALRQLTVLSFTRRSTGAAVVSRARTAGLATDDVGHGWTWIHPAATTDQDKIVAGGFPRIGQFTYAVNPASGLVMVYGYRDRPSAELEPAHTLLATHPGAPIITATSPSSAISAWMQGCFGGSNGSADDRYAPFGLGAPTSWAGSWSGSDARLEFWASYPSEEEAERDLPAREQVFGLRTDGRGSVFPSLSDVRVDGAALRYTVTAPTTAAVVVAQQFSSYGSHPWSICGDGP